MVRFEITVYIGMGKCSDLAQSEMIVAFSLLRNGFAKASFVWNGSEQISSNVPIE